MSGIHDVEGVDCRTCGEPLEAGDDITCIWDATVKDDGHTVEESSLAYHHSTCVEVRDGRPSKRRWYVRENANGDRVAHLVRARTTGDGLEYHGSLCGSIEEVPEDEVESDHVPLRNIDGLCGNCKRRALDR